MTQVAWNKPYYTRQLKLMTSDIRIVDIQQGGDFGTAEFVGWYYPSVTSPSSSAILPFPSPMRYIVTFHQTIYAAFCGKTMLISKEISTKNKCDISTNVRNQRYRCKYTSWSKWHNPDTGRQRWGKLPLKRLECLLLVVETKSDVNACLQGGTIGTHMGKGTHQINHPG